MAQIKRSTPRNITFTKNINPYAYGSVIAEFGNTKVHITASVETKVPHWMKGSGKGWVTAEYSMLPGSTHDRIRRETSGLKGRTQEIQRLIGRALRAVVDMKKLGENQIVVDCDVLVADGGTRTTSISGAYIALKIAVDRMLKEGIITQNPIIEGLAAISIGLDKEGNIISDLNYEEDSTCEADVNIVMTESNKFVEVQGTAEGEPFTREQLSLILDCAQISLQSVFKKQKEIIG